MKNLLSKFLAFNLERKPKYTFLTKTMLVRPFFYSAPSATVASAPRHPGFGAWGEGCGGVGGAGLLKNLSGGRSGK